MPRIAESPICSREDLEILKKLSASCTHEARMVERANIILLAHDGLTDTDIADELAITLPTVGKWRRRYIEEGLDGLFDRPRSGRPPIYEPNATRTAILSKLEEPPPKGQAGWDGKALAEALNISDDKVYRVLRENGICLQKRRSWCVSKDPDFAKKAADIVNLYLNPPQDSIVLSLDEKTSIQALERLTGYVRYGSGTIVKGHQSTYIRRGTTNLFAAFNVSTGKVIGCLMERKRRVDFLEFMDTTAGMYPEDQEIHMIMDNYCIHKRCDDWLAAHPNFTFHVCPDICLVDERG